MLTIWILRMTKLVWMNIMPVCQWNWICEDLFHNFFPLYFKKLAFSKIRFSGPHFCWPRSPLGPHLTQSWVSIGSPFWTKLGPRGTWEQCIPIDEICNIKHWKVQNLKDNIDLVFQRLFSELVLEMSQPIGNKLYCFYLGTAVRPWRKTRYVY